MPHHHVPLQLSRAVAHRAALTPGAVAGGALLLVCYLAASATPCAGHALRHLCDFLHSSPVGITHIAYFSFGDGCVAMAIARAASFLHGHLALAVAVAAGHGAFAAAVLAGDGLAGAGYLYLRLHVGEAGGVGCHACDIHLTEVHHRGAVVGTGGYGLREVQRASVVLRLEHGHIDGCIVGFYHLQCVTKAFPLVILLRVAQRVCLFAELLHLGGSECAHRILSVFTHAWFLPLASIPFAPCESFTLVFLLLIL